MLKCSEWRKINSVTIGKQCQIFTTRSVKNEDLTVQAHWRLNSLMLMLWAVSYLQ